MHYFTDGFDKPINSSRKGAASEYAACIWLLSQGYEVFKNVAASGVFDIVAIKGKEILKIDVKSASLKTGEKVFYAQRRAQHKIAEQGGNILYIFRDGSCKWDYEADKHYGKKVGEVRVGGQIGNTNKKGFVERQKLEAQQRIG